MPHLKRKEGKKGVDQARPKRAMVLTGGPGTGKTTAINAMIALFEQQADKVFLAAPTGRAAKRMSELCGREASTIHRLLEVDYSGSEQMRFIHNEQNPLKCDVVVIDEMSMTDFGPLISNPKSLLLGAAAQLGIFTTYWGAKMLGFTAREAASIGIIGGADGPTAIYVTTKLAPALLGAIAVAAYSYMALVPVIQPPIMKLLTTKKERSIVMTQLRPVSRTEKIIFPIMRSSILVRVVFASPLFCDNSPIEIPSCCQSTYKMRPCAPFSVSKPVRDNIF